MLLNSKENKEATLWLIFIWCFRRRREEGKWKTFSISSHSSFTHFYSVFSWDNFPHFHNRCWCKSLLKTFNIILFLFFTFWWRSGFSFHDFSYLFFHFFGEYLMRFHLREIKVLDWKMYENSLTVYSNNLNVKKKEKV